MSKIVCLYSVEGPYKRYYIVLHDSHSISIQFTTKSKDYVELFSIHMISTIQGAFQFFTKQKRHTWILQVFRKNTY